MALLCIQLNYVVISGQLFFCLLCGLLEKNKKRPLPNNMADRAILVAVLEGYFASLTTLGLPMPLSLQLQQSDLRLEGAMWTAKSTRTGFSVSLFWPVNDATELKQTKKKKRRRRNKRKAKATINLNSKVAPLSAPGSCVSNTPINANPESNAEVDTCNLLPEYKPDSDHSVSPLQELGLSNSNLSEESDVSDQDADEEAAIDLNECSEIVYHHQDDGAHGVKYMCDGREGWTPVVGKRRKYKVPTRLLRLRAPPHVRATLPSSGSESDSESGSDCSLYIPPGADVQYSVCCGKPGLRVTSTSTLPGHPLLQELDPDLILS
jgi:hypothetical protein